jgi:hypothetical protein
MNDVITPISPNDEIIRKSLNGWLPRNFSSSGDIEEAYRNAIIDGNIDRINSSRKLAEKKQYYWNHISADLIKKRLSMEAWGQLFKFTIDRHPYEKAVSQAYFQYAHHKKPNPNFSEFLDLVIKKGTYRNYDLYSDDSGLLVDFVLKFEDLPDCLAVVEEHTGIKIINNLPVTKNNYRKNRTPAIEILTSSQKEFITKHCSEEFDLFGYTV